MTFFIYGEAGADVLNAGAATDVVLLITNHLQMV